LKGSSPRAEAMSGKVETGFRPTLRKTKKSRA
jgi:hypothetical protein